MNQRCDPAVCRDPGVCLNIQQFDASQCCVQHQNACRPAGLQWSRDVQMLDVGQRHRLSPLNGHGVQNRIPGHEVLAGAAQVPGNVEKPAAVRGSPHSSDALQRLVGRFDGGGLAAVGVHPIDGGDEVLVVSFMEGGAEVEVRAVG
jgi:hypothetical protein